MVGRDPPPIRGAEEKVSSFLGVEIGELSYLFILLALQTRYLTEVREQLLRHVDAFGEDPGDGGKVVHKIDKVGAFGIFVDIEAILADAVGTGS
jgi:hypothetical protein